MGLLAIRLSPHFHINICTYLQQLYAFSLGCIISCLNLFPWSLTLCLIFIVSAVEIVYKENSPENVYRNVVFLQDVAVGSWQLQLRHSEADDAESKAHYKFHRSLQMKAHTFCTVSWIFVTYIEKKNMFVGVLKLLIKFEFEHISYFSLCFNCYIILFQNYLLF